MSGSVIRYGVSGWDYRDWQGPLYPKPVPRGFRALPLLARFLDFMEVNVTFYRPVSPEMARRWLDETPSDFTFVIKAWQGWTHEGRPVRGEEAVRFQETLALMGEAGRLEGVLAQYPPSFRDTTEGRHQLLALRDALAPVACFVEVRHRSLYHEGFLRFLEEEGLDFVNVDLPGVGALPGRTRINTGPRAFLRLHGRNHAGWQNARAGRDARYDYDYPQTELDELLDTIRTLASRVPRVLVGANNHFHAHAPAAVVALRSRMEGRRVPVPAALIRSHPQLDSLAAPLEETDASHRT